MRTLLRRLGHRPPATVEIVRDVEAGAGGGRPLRMNIVRPKRGPATAMPVIVYVFGGGWAAGNREYGVAQLIPFAERGFFGASIEYRLSKESIWPAQIEDCKCAVRHLRANAGAYGIDAERIGVWGPSAGGHLAAMLGTTGERGELEGNGGAPEQPSRVQAVCDWYGPTDLLTMGETKMLDHDAPDSYESRLVGGLLQEHKDLARTANPITYVTPGCPPFLIMHGGDDPGVPVSQSEKLHAALLAAGNESTLIIVPGKGHEHLGDEAVATVHAFFDQKLGRTQP